MELNKTNIPSVLNAPAERTASDTNSMFQIGGAPAALAFALMNEILNITMQNMDLYQKVAVAQIEVQRLTTKVAADAQVNAAEAQSWATFTQAMGEIANATVSIAGMAAQTIASKSLTAQTAALEEQMKPLQALKDYNANPAAAAQGQAGNINQPDSTVLNARVEHLKSGPLDQVTTQTKNGLVTPDDTTIAAIKKLRDATDPNGAADPSGYNKYEKNLNKKIDAINESLNANATRLQTLQAQYNQYTQLGTNAANLSSKWVESGFIAENGRHQAEAEAVRGVKDMVNPVVNGALQAINEAKNASEKALQAAAEAAKGVYAN